MARPPLFTRALSLAVRDYSLEIEERLRSLEPASLRVENLTLEEIFVVNTRGNGS